MLLFASSAMAQVRGTLLAPVEYEQAHTGASGTSVLHAAVVEGECPAVSPADQWCEVEVTSTLPSGSDFNRINIFLTHIDLHFLGGVTAPVERLRVGVEKVSYNKTTGDIVWKVKALLADPGYSMPFGFNVRATLLAPMPQTLTYHLLWTNKCTGDTKVGCSAATTIQWTTFGNQIYYPAIRNFDLWAKPDSAHAGVYPEEVRVDLSRSRVNSTTGILDFNTDCALTNSRTHGYDLPLECAIDAVFLSGDSTELPQGLKVTPPWGTGPDGFYDTQVSPAATAMPFLGLAGFRSRYTPIGASNTDGLKALTGGCLWSSVSSPPPGFIEYRWGAALETLATPRDVTVDVHCLEAFLQ